MRIPAVNGARMFLIYKRAKIFRHIQVLVTLLNKLQKGPAMLVFIAAPTLECALSLPTVIRANNVEYGFQATLLLVAGYSYFSIFIILGQMAIVYSTSTATLKDIDKENITFSFRERKWEKRFYKSCPSLKVVISGRNFVDTFTTLNCLLCSLNLSVNVLLLGRDND